MVFEKFFERITNKKEAPGGLEESLNRAGCLPYKVQIIRSKKRRRTINARVAGDTMLVHAPRNISETELRKVINNFAARFQKRKLRAELRKTQDLIEIARRFNKEYIDGKLHIAWIEYSAYQDKKFGCCYYQTKKILISHRLSAMPVWVRDYVIIHELAHLIETNHSKAFWSIVHRYKLAERAIGYLIAVGFAPEESRDTDLPEPEPQTNPVENAIESNP